MDQSAEITRRDRRLPRRGILRRGKSSTATQGAVQTPTLLHGAFAGGRLILWGEIRSDPSGPPGNNGRKHKRSAAESSPYDADREHLIAAINHSGVSIKNCHAETAVIWLPSLNERPLASSGLIAEAPDHRDAVTLRPWTITSVGSDWPATIEFLCACADRKILSPGIIIGEDLSYWAAALRFAAALVAKQHFLPDLVEADGKFQARWRPILTHHESQKLAQLAASMPDAARAIQTGDAPPAIAAASVLSEFVGQVVDHFVRAPSGGPVVPSSKPGASETFDSLDEQWLAALRRPDAALIGDRTALHQLRQRAQTWRRPIAISAASPFRLCFRLEEPLTDKAGQEDSDLELDAASADNSWCLRYLLQAHHDPSLLVTASKAWSAKGREAGQFKLDGFNVREFLLQSLGQAARICPAVESSLQSEIPDGHQIDATGAVRFLTEEAGLLEQAGFGIILPASWTNKGTKLRLGARANVKSPAMQSSNGLSLADLVTFDYELAIGDRTLSYEELMALAKLKTPLVKMRGQWVLLNGEEIQEAIALLKRGTRKLTAREALAMALGASDSGRIETSSVKVEGWLADLMARLKERNEIEDLAAPDGFNGKLRPYQERGYSWLGFLRKWGFGACLADDMGLGKTIQTLALIQRDRQQSPDGPVLLICPMSVIGNWQHEAARFTPGLSVLVHHGGDRIKGEEFREAACRHDVVLTSYGLLQRDLHTLGEVQWSGIVLDEAQNIKNPESKQARSARALKGAYRIALTGTPVENHIGDLWSLMEFLNPGLLGNRAEFKRSFFVPIQASRDPKATQQLKSLTGPFILRRLKTDRSVISDLPDKLEMTVYCTLTKEQASLYAAVVKEALPALEDSAGIKRKGLVLATLSKLKQVCNHPAQFLGDNSAIEGRSGKLQRLTEMLEEVLEEGERALIFSQFAEMGEIIRRHLEAAFGREVLFLHGAVPKLKRDRMVAQFQQSEKSGPAFFVLSLKAGGTGLNLTAANHVFHFDRWWNPAVENQATDRAFRIGQRRKVLVHKFLCGGTLEEKIDTIIAGKKALAESVVGTGEEWLTKLSTAELRDLFALSAQAVAE